ncbi:diaminopimelate decarboxylase [Prevotella bivia DNF00650]|uniref:diaminopimelate decarboxylase n=1 Tax=Prevotella bivia TaxID=28125 RepID=UPI00050E103D|nr:diaminopimelate decarboxylase [Prevotella bivia]KGF38383.1 diaminopimelate decarboxylase [Prevotella bivia DNF00650]
MTYPIEKFKDIETPFYYYDSDILRHTLRTISEEISKHIGFHVHYAIKANANPDVLNIIKEYNLGADCVSGGEIERSINSGFPAKKVVYAGVGKADWEIELALDHDIFCFNVESLEELAIINEIAEKKEKNAKVCFRINPNVVAHTHTSITTGLAENKFGIALQDIHKAIKVAKALKNIEFIGLHFHIGSQILDMEDFIALCNRINEIQDDLEVKGIKLKIINVGGGLGIDYNNPSENLIPNFKLYFDTYAKYLQLREGQEVHFELGRSVTGQMGSLITKVLYIKHGSAKKFAILDAGMTDLVRPALYQAHHEIINLSSTEVKETYDVVGPICESSDIFAKDILLPKLHRGDYVALQSAGAYGEIMASQYNCRKLPIGYLSDKL